MNKKLNEATGSDSSGKFKVPIVLAPELWTKDQLAPFTDDVYSYKNAELAYEEADGDFKESPKKRNEIERKTKKLSKLDQYLKRFYTGQNDDEGSNIADVRNPQEIIKKAEGPLKENFLKEDLAVWFGTKKKPKGSKQPKGPWVNICRKENGKHPPCGRPEAKSKGYPKCRAVHVASKMSSSEKRAACQQKRKAEKKEPKYGTGNKPTMTSYKPKNENIMKKINEDSLIKMIKKILKEERTREYDFVFRKNSSIREFTPATEIYLKRRGNTYDVFARKDGSDAIEKTELTLPLESELAAKWDGERFLNVGPTLMGNKVANTIKTRFEKSQGNWIIYTRDNGSPAMGRFVVSPQLPSESLKSLGKNKKNLKKDGIYTSKDYILVNSKKGVYFKIEDAENAQPSDI